MDREVLEYIIRFLIQDPSFVNYDIIFYGKEQVKKGLLILQSDFFEEGIYGKKESLPCFPLKCIEEIPILFGEPIIEENDLGIIIKADLIASSFFLLSRYEEWIRNDVRDKHGRFPGKESVLYKADVIDIPVVDYYGRIIRKCLRKLEYSVQEPKEEFASIALTHDIDVPWTPCDDFWLAVKRIGRSIIYDKKKPLFHLLLNAFHNYSCDPFYNFDKIIRMDSKLKHKGAKSIFFAVAGVTGTIFSSFDYMPSAGFRKLVKKFRKHDCDLGIHISYEAGGDPSLIFKEKEKFETITGGKVTASRHHYLRSCNPQDMEVLIEVGITDDYTMSYADVAGFRLGTARNVYWINPIKRKLTSLMLHPLQIMECTLNDSAYMNLNEQEAWKYCQKIIRNTKIVNGDLSLLWHNTTLASNNPDYTRGMYERILNGLQKEI